jgi:acyl-CoA synthetase (AMP-forming)/AMP-acid ligase II
MKGYFDNEEATAATIRADGWMHTGDVAKFDADGRLYITDRCKELIKYKGFQVAPAELEGLIGAMDKVADVIVIPVLDDEAGELPRAYVVKASDDLTAEEVCEYISSKVAHYKKLRGGVRFVDTVPKSASGKLLRRLMVAQDRAEGQ